VFELAAAPHRGARQASSVLFTAACLGTSQAGNKSVETSEEATGRVTSSMCSADAVWAIRSPGSK